MQDTKANLSVSKGLLIGQYGQDAENNPISQALRKRRKKLFEDKMPDMSENDNFQPQVDQSNQT
jgi:hypothetical protein